MRVALAGEVPGAPSSALMRLGYLGPAGTFSRRRCGRRPRGDGAPSSSRFRRSTRRSWRSQDGAVDRGARADRELARGRGERDARRARPRRAARSPSSARPCSRSATALIARGALALDDDRGRRLPPAGARPVRALPARASCRARASSPPRRRRRRCARSPQRRRPWAAIGTRARRRAVRLRGAARGRRGRARQRDALRLARPRPATPAGGRRRGALEDVRRLRRRRRPSRRAGSCAACREFAFRGVNLTRIESRPRKRPARPLPVPRRPEGRAEDAAVADAIDGAGRRTARRCACSGAIPRRDAAIAGWSAPRTATLPAQGTPPWGVTHHQAEGRPRRFRAPAART